MNQIDISYYIQTYQNIAFIVSLATMLSFPLVIALLYILQQQQHKQGNQEFYRLIILYKLTVDYIRLYQWVLFIPFNYSILYHFNTAGESYFNILINLFIIIYHILWGLFSYFVINDNYQKKDSLNSRNITSFFLYNTYRLITIIILVNIDSLLQSTLLLIAQILYFYYLITKPGLLGVYSLLQLFKYLFIIQIGFQTGQFLNAIYNYANDSETISYYNIGLISLIVIFSLSSLIEFKLQNHLNCTSLEDLQFKLEYIETIILSDYKNFYIGMILQHLQDHCKIRNTKSFNTCFCNRYKIYDTKHKLLTSTSLQSMIHHTSLFFKLLVKGWFESLHQQENKDANLNIEFAKFLYYKLNYINAAVQSLQKISAQSSLIQQYQKYQLLKMINIRNETNLKQSYDGMLSFEQVLILESQFHEIQSTIKTVLEQQVQIWNLFRSQYNSQNEILKISQKIENLITLIDWTPFLKELRFANDNILNQRKLWKYIYLWSKVYVHNKKLKLQEQEELCVFDSKTFIEESISEDSGSDDEIIKFKQNSASKPFNNQSLILMTDTSPDCEIQQCSQSYQITGYQKAELLKERISSLIVGCQNRNHQIAVQNFLRHGYSNSQYKRLKVFIVQKSGYIIQCQKYLKLLVDQSFNLRFICMIRPITTQQKSNYMIFNEHFELNRMTSSIANVIPQKFFNILILAPKLMQFSKFAKYLKGDDINMFKLSLKQDSISQLEQPIHRHRRSHSILLQNIRTQHLIQNSENQTLQDTNSMFENDEEMINYKLLQLKDKIDINITFRMPKQIDKLNEEYLIAKHSLREIKLEPCSQKIVVRDRYGVLKIIKYRFLKQIKIFVSKERLILYKHFKKLYQTYCLKPKDLEMVIKMNVSLKLIHKGCIDSYMIMKINRFEVYDPNRMNYARSQVYNESNGAIMAQTAPRIQSETEYLSQEQQIFTGRTNQSQNLITDINMLNEQSLQNFDLLKLQENIFIKEDNNKAQKRMRHIEFIKLYNRAFTLVIFILLSILFSLGFRNVTTLITDVYGTDQFLAYFNYIQYIVTTYDVVIEYILYNYGITGPFYTSSQFAILQTRELFYNYQYNRLMNSDDLYNQTFSNEFIVTINQYSISYLSNISALDQFTTFEQVLYNLEFIDALSFNDDNYLAKWCRQTMIPSIYFSTSMTLNGLLDLCTASIKQSYRLYVTLLIISIILLFINFLYTFYTVNSIINKAANVYIQTENINKSHVKDVYIYQKQLLDQFNLTLDKPNRYNYNRSDNLLDNLTDKSEKFVKLNNTHSQFLDKNNQAFKYWTQLKKLLILTYVICMLMMIIPPIIYPIYMSLQLVSLETIISENAFIRNTLLTWVVPMTKDLMILQKINPFLQINQTARLGLLQEFIDQVNSADPQIFKTNFDEISLLFTGDICNLNRTCEQLGNGALQNGIKQFYTLISQAVYPIVNSSDLRYEYPTIPHAVEYNLMWMFVQQAILKANNIWQDKFNIASDTLSEQELIWFICAILSLSLLYIFIIEIYMYKELDKLYSRVRKFYKRFYPNELLNTDKRIRAILVQSDLLSR